MSRTKRLHDGAPTDGPRKADYYATPAWAVRALQVQRPGGWVWMLLRMMWINDGQATHRRVTWLRETVGMPRVLALPRRPSFTGKGNDATTYAWFGWQSGVVEKVGTFEILPEGADHV